MVAFLDEYNPNSNNVKNRVQSDPNKLKFLNIQSCIAVAIYPTQSGQLVGVHLTTSTTGNKAEMKTARDELRQAMGNAPNARAYLVANYKTHHAGTTLKRELSKIVSSVQLCNVSSVSVQNQAADIDVKVELAGGVVRCFAREHAQFQTAADGHSRIPKPLPVGGWIPGQPRNMLDKTGKPWVQVAFRPI